MIVDRLIKWRWRIVEKFCRPLQFRRNRQTAFIFLI